MEEMGMIDRLPMLAYGAAAMGPLRELEAVTPLANGKDPADAPKSGFKKLARDGPPPIVGRACDGAAPAIGAASWARTSRSMIIMTLF